MPWTEKVVLPIEIVAALVTTVELVAAVPVVVLLAMPEAEAVAMA